MEELDIRYSTLDDGKHIKKWLKNPETRKWYPASDDKEAEEEVQNWIGFSKFRASLTAEWKKEVCGVGTLFLMPYKKVAHHCMFYMIVGPEFRNKGIGTSLLKNILNLADNYFSFESIDVEVFEGCPLIPLLKKFQFESFVYQEKYVKENGQYLARILYQKFFEKKRFSIWRI